MSVIRRFNKPQGLKDIDVLIEDDAPISLFFNVVEVPEVITQGKSSFLIGGSNLLKPEVEIKFEITNDDTGAVIYTEPVSGYLEGTSRRVSIEVYDDVELFGDATLTVVGELTSDEGVIPDEWLNKPNVRLILPISITLNEQNISDAVFRYSPKVSLQEFRGFDTASNYERAYLQVMTENMETIADNMVESSPTIVVCVPRVFEKIHAKFMQGIKSAPKIRQNLFNWALNVGSKYSNLKVSKQKIGIFLSLKHKIADKLIYSKVKARFGGKIKFFVSGGAPLSKHLAEFFAAVDITILEGYGLTETSPVLTVNSPTDLKFGYVGKPLFNVNIKIADDGEILAKGPNIMTKYYRNEEATNEVFDNDGWFHTGDIGIIDEDGFLKITDRKKSLIVTSGGKNIAPAPIEVKLTSSPYIEQIHIVGDKRNFLTALIVPNFDSVINYLKEKGNNLSDFNAIVEHPDVIDLFNKEIEKSMVDFAKFEQVKKFTLIPNPFSIDKGEMTPKMSIVRKVVEANYSELINSMYN